jgi:formamidopyrimidine-DNA glycosylase
MPELPEVETVRSIIEREVAGKTILGVTYGAFPEVTAPLAPVAFADAVVGRTFRTPLRRGKYLLLPLDDGSDLLIHLRMTGRLLIVAADQPPVRFEHLALRLDNGLDLRYADQRKFGRVTHLPVGAADEHLATRLGPEPLGRGFTAGYLTARLRGRTAPIKTFLLDQRNVAGLGNIYVDEALFLARLHPLTPAGQLSDDQVTRLARSIRRVLRTAIDHQGTTFSSFENPYGESGGNAARLNVYGRARAGLPCTRCGTILAWIRLGGRGTSYCPRCQPMRDRAPESPHG